MKFVDQVRLEAKAGDGGNGAIAFRREKYIPFGGPAGGDGARGGDVIFEGDEGRTSLLDLASGPKLRAKNGEHGRGKDQYGRAGEDLIVRVPVGTEVYDAETDVKICDITGHGERVIVAHGGKGGRGNIHFSTPFDRAPRRAEPGAEGEDRRLRLELKVLADVGLLGFPNVGKSTLVASMSRARPKIADYPFTTLHPNLGVVRVAAEKSFVMADIPGLIEGASEGLGLGHALPQARRAVPGAPARGRAADRPAARRGARSAGRFPHHHGRTRPLRAGPRRAPHGRRHVQGRPAGDARGVRGREEALREGQHPSPPRERRDG